MPNGKMNNTHHFACWRQGDQFLALADAAISFEGVHAFYEHDDDARLLIVFAAMLTTHLASAEVLTMDALDYALSNARSARF